jgi:starch synthase/alpha-amylase
MPDYRTLFSDQFTALIRKELKTIRNRIPQERIHLAEDRAFYYQSRVYLNYEWENIKIALAFQREVINNIIPHVQPDLIHCNDWTTGLVPALARELEIPSLFILHNIHTVNCLLYNIEDRGIDAAEFWHHLYYDRFPVN